MQWNRNDNDKFSAHADTNHNLFVCSSGFFQSFRLNPSFLCKTRHFTKLSRWVIPIESYAMIVMEDISLYSPILRPWALSVSRPKHIKPPRNLIRIKLLNSFNRHNGFSASESLRSGFFPPSLHQPKGEFTKIVLFKLSYNFVKLSKRKVVDIDLGINTLQGTITYPTLGSSENHRLNSAGWDGIC